MNKAKLFTKGQVTLPIEADRELSLEEGNNLFISEENGHYDSDDTDHDPSILSGSSFANNADLEVRLDEADRQAAETKTRYSADEVFNRVMKNYIV